MYKFIPQARAAFKRLTLKQVSIALPVVAFLFVLANFVTHGELLNRLEAIPSTYLSSNTTAAAQAAGTLITALSSNGFTLGSSALVNSVGTANTATSFTYTSDGNTSTPYGTPHGAAVTGNYLFVSHNGDDRIAVYDISTTDSPTFLTTISTSCTIGDIEIYGTTLYVTNYTGNNFRVYDLSASTTAPSFVRTVTTGTYPIGIRASAAGYIYVANNTSNTISIYNASTPTNPTLSSTYTLPSNNPTGLAVKGTVLYVAHYDQALVRVLNISSPTAPSSATTLSVGTNPMGLAVYNNVLLVANYTSNTLHQWNISTALSPVASSNASFSAGGTGPSGIAFSTDGKEAYVVNKSSNSFTSYNMGKEKYVAWNWKCGTTSGCDILTNTLGTTGINTINHNLGAVPKMMIAKRTDGTEQWLVYHSDATTQSQYLTLNSSIGITTSANLWGNTPITSSQFHFYGTAGRQYQFYLFAEKPGFSKFGSYTGNNSTDGPFVYTGFKPRFLLLKTTTASPYTWVIKDTARDVNNPATSATFADATSAEASGSNSIDVLANGFKIRSDNTYAINPSGGTVIYAAFAEHPFEYATTNNTLSIATSTRFNGTNAYLSRTPGSAGNQTTWTYSTWIKQSDIASGVDLLSVGIDAYNYTRVSINGSGQIYGQSWNGIAPGTLQWSFTTAAQLRDPSVWQHITVNYDSSQVSPTNRLVVYVNGVQQKFSSVQYPTLNFASYINAASLHRIMSLYANIFSPIYSSGYLSDIYFLDGQAVAPTSFAGADTNGRWSPKTYTGSFLNTALGAVASVASTGFTVSSNVIANTLNDNYVAWNWKESPTSGFDIVTYTGTGANRTVSHSLGATPAFMLVKRTDSAANWTAWHQSLTSTTTGYLIVNSVNPVATAATMWNSTAPTSAVISLGTDATVNASGGAYTAYLWSEKPGFSKFGSYVANGSTDGNFIYTGFKPRYILIKRTDSTGVWVIWDTARNTYNVQALEIEGNNSNAEVNLTGGAYDYDILANGFKLRGVGGQSQSTSGGTYTYAAFAEYPFEYASTNSGLTIASSTRFNGTNAYLQRTPSAQIGPSVTLSVWTKRSKFGTAQDILNRRKAATCTNSGLGFDTSDRLVFDSLTGGENTLTYAFRLVTNQVFRDPSRWYHIVGTYDGTTAKLYVDGVQVTSFATNTQNGGTPYFGSPTCPMVIGTYGSDFNTNNYDGYMSDYYIIDGQALSPTSFAQTDSNGRWSPKAYAGYCGTNGFHLDFSTSTVPGYDSCTNIYISTTTISTVGTTTYTVPANIASLKVTVDGPSGGSGGRGNCGGNSATDGSAGSAASKFNNTLIAGPGGGGGRGTPDDGVAGAGGSSGSATGGDTNTVGGAGNAPFNSSFGSMGNCDVGGAGGSGGRVVKTYFNGDLATGSAISVFVGTGGTPGTNEIGNSAPSGNNGSVQIVYTSSVATSTYNSFTNTNIAATDNVADSPTNNYATWNPVSGLNSAGTFLSNGSLTITDASNSGSWRTVGSTPLLNSGKWYFETTIPSSLGHSIGNQINFSSATSSFSNPASAGNYGVYWNSAGTNIPNNLVSINGSTQVTTLGTFALNDTINIAVDVDSGKMWIGKNGTWYTGNPALGTAPTHNWAPYAGYFIHSVFSNSAGPGGQAGSTSNFGQGGQSGLTYDSASGGYFKYTPPSGFKALSSANMIAAGTTNSSLVKSNNWFDAVLYTGTGAVQSISSLAFQPDLVWIKDRTSALNHVISDAVTGITCYLSSNTTAAKSCASAGNSFHLPLMGTSSAASIGTDTSGAGNFFTNNNIAATDAVIDTPTNNFATINSLASLNAIGSGGVTSSGNLTATANGAGSDSYIPTGTIITNGGKWYTEYTMTGLGHLSSQTTYVSLNTPGQGASVWFAYDKTGQSYTAASGWTSPGWASYAVNDVIGVAVDHTSTSVSVMYYKNGVLQGTSTQAIAGDLVFSSRVQAGGAFIWNSGQGGQSGLTYDAASGGYFKYTPPSGFKALSSANMIAAGTTNSSLVKSNNYFDVVTYEGNGTTKVISSLNFQPDFIWIKDRTTAVNHVLFGDGTTISSSAASFFQWFEF